MAARKKAQAEAPKVNVTLRRSNGGGGVPKGSYVLLLNPKVFGSTGANFHGGEKAIYSTRELAIAAAAKSGATVLNPGKATAAA